MGKLFGLLAALFFVTAAQAQIPGHAYVKNVSGTYEGFTPSGATQCWSSTTDCISEMLSYAWTNNIPLDIFGGGSAAPFTITAALKIPAGQYQYVKCYGCYFNPVMTTDVMTIDTLRSSEIDFSGAVWIIGRSTYGIHIAPTTALSGVSAANVAQGTHYSFGNVEANTTSGDAPTNLITIDINSTCGSDQEHSSAWVDNILEATTLNGRVVNQSNFVYLSPTCQYSTGGENIIRIGNNENAGNSEYKLGNYLGGAYDGNIGSNHYFGNLQHTASGSGTYAVISDSSYDYFLAQSVNEYNGTPYAFYYGPKACGNVVRSTQFIYETAFNGGYSCSTHPNVNGAP
jgi:hypothetical protein